MVLDSEQYNRIIRFLDAEMSINEMADFESELDSNPNMRQHLDFEQSIRDVFAQRNQEDSQKVKKDFFPLSQKVNKGKKKGFYVYLAVAASIIGIISWSVLFKNSSLPSSKQLVQNDSILKTNDSSYNNNSIQTNQANDLVYASLFNKYFSKDKSPDNSPILLADALIDYDNGNYTSLQSLDLTKIPEIRGDDTLNDRENILQLGHYYKGISYLETGDSKMAIQNLNWVVKHSSNTEIVTKADWYLALGYVINKEKEKSKTILKELLQNKRNNHFSQKAKELYNILNNLK